MVKFFVAMCALYTLYAAEEPALIYQAQGVEALTQALDRELATKAFWQRHLSVLDTTYGYLEGRDALLTCNKKEGKLYYHKRQNDGSFKTVHHYDALLGKSTGDKQIEGDHRTPIGIYTLTQKLDKLDPYYGPLAYVTSYPNLFDRIRGKNGSGIWIHGVPENTLRETATKGCIALENSDLRTLDAALDMKRTLLIIDEEVKFDIDKERLATLLSQLFAWRLAWLNNDLEGYLAFYDESFKRFDGRGIDAFRSYKKRIFAKGESKSIYFSNIAVLPYPGDEPNHYLITFHERYFASSYQFEGEKTLITTLKNAKMRIIAEQ